MANNFFLKNMVIPLKKDNLIFPTNLMVELTTFDTETLATSHHAGIEGWLYWRGRKVPLLSIESLCFLETDEMKGTNEKSINRCIIFHTLTECDKLPFIAFQVKGSPHSLDVSPDTLQIDQVKNKNRCPYIASSVRVANLHCMIPDLPAIEAVVIEILT